MIATSFRLFASAFICGMSLGAALAQSPDDTLTPREPLVGHAPDGGWTIAYKYKDPTPSPTPGGGAAPSKADRIISVKVEKKGATFHVLTTKTSGLQLENWVITGLQLYKAPGDKSYIRLQQDNPLYYDFSKSDFDELSWISKEYYIGVKKGASNDKVFVFEVKNASRPTVGHEKSADDLTAMIAKMNGLSGKRTDQATLEKGLAEYKEGLFGGSVSRASLDVTNQLPVEYDDGSIVRTYTYTSDSPPSAPMELMQQIQAMRLQMQRKFVRISPP